MVAEKGQPTSADPVAARPNYSGRSALRPFNWREIFKTGCALIGISRHAGASYQASPAQRVMAGYSDSYDEMDRCVGDWCGSTAPVHQEYTEILRRKLISR